MIKSQVAVKKKKRFIDVNYCKFTFSYSHLFFEGNLEIHVTLHLPLEMLRSCQHGSTQTQNHSLYLLVERDYLGVHNLGIESYSL